MENNERRNRIAVLKEEMHPIRYELLFLGLDYENKKRLYDKTPSDELKEQVSEVKKSIDGLNAKLTPLIEQYAALVVRYFIEYEIDSNINGRKVHEIRRGEYNLSTYLEIDSRVKHPDINDEDFGLLITELAEVMQHEGNFPFTLMHIKFLQIGIV